MPTATAEPTSKANQPPIKSFAEIPDEKFKGPVSAKKDMASFFKGAAKAPDDPAEKKPDPKPESAPADEGTGIDAPGDSKADPGEEMLSELPKKAKTAPEDSKVEEGKAAKPPGGQLRENLEKALDENKRLKARLGELEPLAESHKEVEVLRNKAKELEDRVHWLDYRESDEYKERFEKPIETAIASANRLVGKLKVQSEDRVGKASDVAELYRLWVQNSAAAVERAQELFGSASERVLDRIQEAADASDRAQEAIETWKKESGVRREQQTTAARDRLERLTRTYRELVQEQVEDRPELFRFDDDSELKSAGEKYSKLADQAFIVPEGMKPDEAVKIQATVRNWAAAFVPTRLKLEKANQRIAELEAQLKELTNSTPSVRPVPAKDGSAVKVSDSDVLRTYLERKS